MIIKNTLMNTHTHTNKIMILQRLVVQLASAKIIHPTWDIYFSLGYLKIYQLKSPTLPYDCILVDEAQDFNPGK